MKKILVSLLFLVTISQLQAISKEDVARDLAGAINNLNLETFEPTNSISRQQLVVTLWDNSVTKAKKFISDNSMDLLKRADSLLIGDLSKIDELNNEFTNTIKIIRGAMPNPPISRLLQVSTNAKKLIELFEKQSFTLPNKKDALFVLTRIATFIANSSTYLYSSLVAKK